MKTDVGRPSLISVSLLAILVALSGCDGPPPAPGSGQAGQPPEVGVITVEARPTTLTTELPGRTSPYRIAEVRPQVGGIIEERPFEEGGQISAGQVLYQIDAAPFEAAFASAEAALTRARATRERARLKAERFANLVKTDAISQDDFDDAQAAFEEAAASVAVAAAELQTARINLDYTRVTSPIDGRIGRSMMTQGALVTAYQGPALATVQQLDPIYVDLSQSSTQLLQLRRAFEDGRLARTSDAQPEVTLILEDGSTYEHSGRLAFSEVTVDEGTGAVTLRATFPNPDHVLLPGMFVRAIVAEGVRRDAILVPQQGVQHDRRGNPVALVVAEDGTVAQRMLKTERAMGSKWLIDDGLEPGDRLIVEGAQKVRAGTKVRIADLSDRPAFAAAMPSD